MTDREEALKAARALWAGPVVFLDTETTGLDPYAQVCELAIVGKDGEQLVNTLIKPTVPILEPAQGVHGITDEMVKDAPSFDEAWAEALPCLDRPGLTVCIYNASFDVPKMRQSSKQPMLLGLPPCECIMELYAQYWGDWSQWHGNYKWQSLGAAAAQCGLLWPMGAHRALADAEMCRRVLEWMATRPAPGQPAP